MSVDLQMGFLLLPRPAKIFLASTFASTAFSICALSLARSCSRSIDGGLEKKLGKRFVAIVVLTVGLAGTLINIGALRLMVTSINRHGLIAIGITSGCIGTLLAGIALQVTSPYGWKGRRSRFTDDNE